MATGGLFSVLPSKFVHFTVENGVFSSVIQIVNESSDLLAYRIQTNSKEDYIVTPAAGFIEGKEKVAVSIHLKQGSIFAPAHAFVVHGARANDDEWDRTKFWEVNRHGSSVTLGIRYPPLDEVRVCERLVEHVKALRSELRRTRRVVDRQKKMVSAMSTSSCSHPPLLMSFLVGCFSIGLVLFLYDICIRYIPADETVSWIKNS